MPCKNYKGGGGRGGGCTSKPEAGTRLATALAAFRAAVVVPLDNVKPLLNAFIFVFG